MRSLYISQQGCYITLQQETLIAREIHGQVQLPLLEQILCLASRKLRLKWGWLAYGEIFRLLIFAHC